MTYEESILAPGERIVGTFRAHALPGIGFYWLALAGGGAVTAAGIASGAGMAGTLLGGALAGAWAAKLLAWKNSVLVVTNRRVIKGSGVIAKQTRDSALDKITDLELSQGVVGRILDYGTLSILTANEKAEDVFHGLARPKAAKSALLEAKSSMETRGVAGVGQGGAEGDISAIERLNRRGLLGDDEAKVLLAKLLSRGGGAEGV
jgi:uncharacterized membrane protein YdbT with pleckstrin-like domain